MKTRKNDYTLEDAFKLFKKERQEKGKTCEGVRKYEFKTICRYFNQMLTDEVSSGKKIRLPAYCGSMVVTKHKTDYDNIAIDWGNTQKYGKRMYHLALHSDGFVAAITWIQTFTYRRENQPLANYHRFKGVYEFRQKVCKQMQKKDGHVIYLEQYKK